MRDEGVPGPLGQQTPPTVRAHPAGREGLLQVEDMGISGDGIGRIRHCQRRGYD